MPDSAYESLTISAQDGLRLHVRAYGPQHSQALPVVCLPGLARTGADFHELACALAGDPQAPRRVLALDYRGRGLSDHDRNPDNYNLATEVADLLAVLTACGIGRAAFVGTSRGGLIAMLLGSARPGAIAAALLNDIGPVIDPKGLMRIKSYVGKLPPVRTHQEGAEVLRRLFDAQFPKLDSDDWLKSAERLWIERKGRLQPAYDVKLARTLEGIDIERPLPTLWPEFDSLAAVPLLVIRGANSDILSAETVEAMRARRSHFESLEVPDQGHPPTLADAETIGRIAAFVAQAERTKG